MSEIVEFRKRVLTMRQLLQDRKGELQAALPRHISADRMLRLVLTTIQRNPKLLDCTQASVIGSVMQAAQLGLEIDDLLGTAYLVPFRNKKSGQLECQLIPGYKGLMNLARRSGEVADIDAKVVYSADFMDFEYGSSRFLKHKPARGNRGEMSSVWAAAYLKDMMGNPHFEVMSKAEVEAIRARSRAKDAGPWVTDEEAMWLKTAIRRLCKQIPASTELQAAIALDEQADIGLPQPLPELPEVSEPTEPERKPPEPPRRRGRPPGTKAKPKPRAAPPEPEPEPMPEPEPGEEPLESEPEAAPEPEGPTLQPYDPRFDERCPNCERFTSLIDSAGHRQDCPYYQPPS
jgi:recombination protein RecT